MTEISLNASMRSNLLSLQQTQKLQDRTQLRLSTGLKVNSAIDNPSSYYTATSLNNRASDLSALLDTMSQGIQTIKAANEALETGTANASGWATPDWNEVDEKLSNSMDDNYTDKSKQPENMKLKPSDSNSFREIISQYDMLINDASYKDVNLLQSNDLKINFNEERTSGLEVKGVDTSTEGLGIHSLEWETQMDVLNSIEELENAINQLRSISAAFGNYYSIVTTREGFTENLINVLTEGADKLTLADINAESANMLALQTRQQLAINSLSLASQAAQSVLRLF